MAHLLGWDERLRAQGLRVQHVASLYLPASARHRFGVRPVFSIVPAVRGLSRSLSTGWFCTSAATTMLVWASTAACALYAYDCNKATERCVLRLTGAVESL